jgi:hypothetical protein
MNAEMKSTPTHKVDYVRHGIGSLDALLLRNYQDAGRALALVTGFTQKAGSVHWFSTEMSCLSKEMHVSCGVQYRG